MNEDEALREFLLTHVRSPKNSKPLESSNASGECRNPLCGDHVKIHLNVKDTIEDVQLAAQGCAISVASASLMSELIKGLKVADAEDRVKSALLAFKSSSDLPWPEELTLLIPLKRVREIPMKVPCALIGWLAFENALKNVSASSAS